jgi:hypothetical protein
MYFNLLTAGVVGYLLLGETPTAETLTGMAVIAAGGMLIALQGREGRGDSAIARFVAARKAARAAQAESAQMPGNRRPAAP